MTLLSTPVITESPPAFTAHGAEFVVPPVIMVRPVHCRHIRYCARGMRAFFKRHDLNWQEFLQHGLPVEVIRATGDAMALRAADIAEERASDGLQ